MKPLMLNGIAESARYWFLAGYFVKGLGTPFASDYLIGHERFVFIRFFDCLSRNEFWFVILRVERRL
jgi:hypothetical protein